MPIPAAVLPQIIAGGAALVGQGINAISQARANKQQLRYNQQTYQQQRKDSLADYNMQNKYASPQQQMQRLQEAGLNPALVYGKGTIDNMGGRVATTDTKNYSPIAPKIDSSQIGDSISQIADIQLKKAQTDNLRSAIETSVENRYLLKAQALKVAKDTDYTVFRQMRDSLLLPGSLDAQQATIRSIDANTKNTLDSNDRAAAMNSSNLREAVERILSSREQRAKTIVEKEYIRQQIKNLGTSNQLQILDKNLKELGVQPTDNIIFRAAGQFLNSTFGNIKDKVKSFFK